MKWIKKGRIIEPRKIGHWWSSHAMAPSAIVMRNSHIRVFLGCWDSKGISRIGYIDLDLDNPLKIICVSEKPVLDIGRDGTFDENGVFPAHVNVIGDQIYLYYTGFQLGHKIRHYNFGGLAIGNTHSDSYGRFSETPLLDRSEEGLFVRAGQSVLYDNGIFKTVYSAGSKWEWVGDKLRPHYDIYYQESVDGKTYLEKGVRILQCDPKIEHGLGRPQIIKVGSDYYIFYTRRLKDMKYFMGCAKSSNCRDWTRIDNQIGISHSENGWDSEMVYFPSVLQAGDKIHLFYSGNDFGRSGFGFAELKSW